MHSQGPPSVKPIYPLVSYLFLNQCALTAARFIVVLYAIQLQGSTAASVRTAVMLDKMLKPEGAG